MTSAEALETARKVFFDFAATEDPSLPPFLVDLLIYADQPQLSENIALALDGRQWVGEERGASVEPEDRASNLRIAVSNAHYVLFEKPKEIRRALDLQLTEAAQIADRWRRAPAPQKRDERAYVRNLLRREPWWVEERLDWLLDGTYGLGWKLRALETTRTKKRGRDTRDTRLFALLMLIEQNLPAAESARIWRDLSHEEQRDIRDMLYAAMRRVRDREYD